MERQSGCLGGTAALHIIVRCGCSSIAYCSSQDKCAEEDYNEHHLVWVHRECASSCKTRYLQMLMIRVECELTIGPNMCQPVDECGEGLQTSRIQRGKIEIGHAGETRLNIYECQIL